MISEKIRLQDASKKKTDSILKSQDLQNENVKVIFNILHPNQTSENYKPGDQLMGKGLSMPLVYSVITTPQIENNTEK